MKEIGAHARGYNRRSIGICYVGGLLYGEPADTRTPARDIEYTIQESNRPSFIYKHEKLMDLIAKHGFSRLYFDNVLDIGERNPFTERLEVEFSINIDSTSGDLDKEFICSKKQYDLVIFSHVIEHLFNPLFCLENIKKVLKPDGIMIIACPIKPHFLTWGKGHFHEMDDYRFRKLIRRAGFVILIWKKFSLYQTCR
ncbi:unnamed protein product, partial [marine sediment metagenome]